MEQDKALFFRCFRQRRLLFQLRLLTLDMRAALEEVISIRVSLPFEKTTEFFIWQQRQGAAVFVLK